MSNGTERDEPGQHGGGARPSPDEPSGDPSADPVWPVWGATGTEPDEVSDGDDAHTTPGGEPEAGVPTPAAPEAGDAELAAPAGVDEEPSTAPEGAPPAEGGADSSTVADDAVDADDDLAADDEPSATAEAATGGDGDADLQTVAPDGLDARSTGPDARPAEPVSGAEEPGAVTAPIDAAETDDALGVAVPDVEPDADGSDVDEASDAGGSDVDGAADPSGAESVDVQRAAAPDDAEADADDGADVAPATSAAAGVAATTAAEADVTPDAPADAHGAAVTAADAEVVPDAADAPPGEGDVAPDAPQPGTGIDAPSAAADDSAEAAAATAAPGVAPVPGSGRDAETAVIPPTAAAATASAASTAVPAKRSAPAPIGTLTAPVTRTLPSAAAASAPPASDGPSATAVAAAATATAAAAATAAPSAGGSSTRTEPAAAAPAAGSSTRTEHAAAAPAAPAAQDAPTTVTPVARAASAAPAESAASPAPPAAAAATARAVTSATPPRVSAGPVAGAGTAGPSAQQAPIPSGPVPPSARKESPLDVFEEEDGKRRWPKRLLIALGVVVVLAAAYVGASYALADRVPRGATVAGVDIGGLPADEAVARLDEELADATTQPIEVVANDVQATIDPVAAGLTFDAQATVDQLTGVDLAEPERLWQHVVGVGAQEPVTSVDEDALAAALSDLGTSLALAPVDGTIVFVDATAQSTDAVDGWNLDQDGAADVLSTDWLEAARPLELPTLTVEPDITQAETDAALVEAQKVTSAPVSVEVSGQLALLDPATLAANASYVPVDGNLVLQMNGQGLSDAVLAQLPGLLTASADAHFEFVNDAPVIVPGTPGTSLDPAALATSVGTAATSSDRTAHVELVQADPSQSTAELEALGVKEIVSEFSTPLTSEPRRTVNIANGASKISGTLIRPDETFSLTDALGPIDAAHGFVEAGAIVSGEHTDAWGGGLSQISTTTYNAAFLAGFEDVEHRPHSEWFARYPEGREATIFTGTLDMRWKNNTPYGALVQAWVSGGRVYVRVWGTKYWTVESITSPRSGVVNPTTVYSQSPTCEASSAGNPGFSVTVTRKTSLNGELKKTESNSWRYKPQNKIVCGPAPTPAAATP